MSKNSTVAKAEEALREIEEYRDLYEEAPIAYYSIGLDGRILRANRRGEELLGYSVEELIGRPVLDLYANTPAGKGKAQNLFQDFRAGEEICEEELEMRGADGKSIWVSLTVRPMRNLAGEVMASRSMAVDITERKRAEAEVRTTQKMLSEAERLANAGSFQWDIAANKVAWSDGLYHIYGLKPQEFDASFEAFLNQVHPDSREMMQQTIETAYRDCEPFQMEERIVRPDGEIRVLFSKGEVITNEQGTPVRMVGSCQDVTERKRAEKEIESLANSHAKTRTLFCGLQIRGQLSTPTMVVRLC